MKKYRVYPRVCGGTFDILVGIPASEGLSPRVRGNRAWNLRAPPISGSIPACAGEPDSLCSVRRIQGVYPRVCGGTSM